MKNIYFTYIVLSLIFLSCQKPRESRIDYLGYEVGQKIDTNWTVILKDDERNFKYNQYQLDSNLTCRTVGDTIWSMMKFNIDEAEVKILINKINSSFIMTADCTYVSKVAGIWDCYQYKWRDSINGDNINLWKCKSGKQKDYGLWELEIYNDSLLNHLNSNHDPYYDMKPPTINK